MLLQEQINVFKLSFTQWRVQIFWYVFDTLRDSGVGNFCCKREKFIKILWQEQINVFVLIFTH